MNAERVFVLEITHGDGVKNHYVKNPEFVLGRGPTSAVKIDDNNISREHVKINYDDDIGSIIIQDLKSSNGTMVNGQKLEPFAKYGLKENDIVTFINSSTSMSIKVMRASPEAHDFVSKAQTQHNEPVNVKISGFPQTEQDLKIDFKNVSLDLPKYRDPGEHAREIIAEANFLKQTIIKGAHVKKEQIINETQIQAKKLAEEAYQEYRNRAELLIDETKMQMQHLKTETESHLDDKRMHALQEIQHLWKEHQDQISEEKIQIINRLEHDAKLKLDIEIERMKNDMFIERNKLLTEAESTIMANTRAYRAQFENEKTEHTEKITFIMQQIEQFKNEHDHLTAKIETLRNQSHEKELELDKLKSSYTIENDKLEAIQKNHKYLEEENIKILDSLSSYSKNKDQALEEERIARKNTEELSQKIASLSQRRTEIEEEVANSEKNLSALKLKAKVEVEKEYQALREVENRKFEEFKVSELKELQKIRTEHANSFKKFSLELSQELASKLELLSKTRPEFDFDKTLEVINSVIQVRSTANAGAETNHQAQLDNWKRKQKSAKFGLFASGAMASVLIYTSGSFLYKQFSKDSLQEELVRNTEARRKKEIENKFVAVKTSQYYDSYVDATIYTNGYVDAYLNKDYQDEWVKKVTVYFLKTWKIDEQKTIQIIANSRSLVQSIAEASQSLTKDKLQSDLQKLRDLERRNVEAQIAILGTNVKYESYKKLERQFFTDKINARNMASE